MIFHAIKLLILVAIVGWCGCKSVDYPAAPSLSSQNAATPISTVSKQGPPSRVRPAAFDEPAPIAAETPSPAPAFVSPVAIRPMVDHPETEEPIDETVVETALPTAAVNVLDLSHLEGIALASHPAIAEARCRIAAACGQYVQAGLPFNPVLQYQSDEIGNEGNAGLHTLTLSQQVVTANKLGIAQQVQAHEANKRRAQLRVIEFEVLTRVRTAYNQTLVAQQRADLTHQIRELAAKSERSVEALLEAKEVSKTALLQARVETQQAQVAAENAAIQLDASRRMLAAAVGAPVPQLFRVAGNPVDGLSDAPWDELLGEITTLSPELAAAGSDLERARWALQLACAQVTPNVTGQVGIGLDSGTDDTYARVGVSIPLPIRNRNQGNIQTARANIASASAAIHRTRLDLESRLAVAAGRYQTARNRHRRLQEQVLPNAEESYALSRQAFDAGETDFIQLLTAQRTLFSVRLSVLDALGSARQSLAEIEGMLVTLKSQ